MIWLDALRILAGVSMICMHATFDWNGQPFPDFTPDQRIAPVALNTIFYLARTELFLIISLFLLAMSIDRRPRSYSQTIKEQSKRLLIPYIFWISLYFFFTFFKAWQLDYLHYIWRDLTTMVDPWLRWFVLGSLRPQMHFLPTLFGLVLFYPLYRYAIKYPALGLLIFGCLYFKRELNIWIYAEFEPIYQPYLLRIARILTYTGYGFLGAAFYGLISRPHLSKWRGLVLTGLLLLGAWALTYKFQHSLAVIETGNWQHNFPNRYWSNLLFPVVLFGTLMLVPIRYPDWIQKMAPYSFGIFLCHPIFLDLYHIVVFETIQNPTLYVTLKMAWAVPMSFLFVKWLAGNQALAWTVGLGPTPNFSAIRWRRSPV